MEKQILGGVVGLLFLICMAEAWSKELDPVKEYQRLAADKGGFSGVILIGRDDQSTYQQASGWADADLMVPIHTGHRFRIGSLTKPVTASAVMIAVDRGMLSLDSAACSFLPTCPESWSSVTIQNLLTHTSGIVDHFGDLESVEVEKTSAELARVLQTLPRDETLQSTPGAEYQYSNFNYVLLGVVLEQVGGKPWEAVLQDWIFEPLNLTSMAYDDVYAIMENRVEGYDRSEDGSLRNIEYDDHAAYAAGGLLATAEDLFRWSRAVMNAELFDASLVEQSLTPYRDNYGYGWQIRQFFDRQVYNHTGGIDGFSSHLAYYPAEGITIVVLANNEADSAILRACDVAARIFSWPILSDPGSAELTPQQRCGLQK